MKVSRPSIKAIFFVVLVLFLSPGCGGGGSSSATVKGVLTDGFGSVINHSSAVLTLDGTGVVAYPNSIGAFSITSEPGSYVLRASFSDLNAGFLLSGSMNVTLTEGQPLDIGAFAITSKTLDSAWTSYRNGQYQKAESEFLTYLDQVRASQAHLGVSSVYSGLGWTRGRGLNDPVLAAGDFQKAIDGWNGNLDAWVGMAAAELSSMKSSGTFRFNQSAGAITSAIDIEGDYSSSPAHDQVSEVDLMAFRAFVNWLNGNTASAVSEAQSISSLVDTSGNAASADAIAIVIAFGT